MTTPVLEYGSGKTFLSAETLCIRSCLIDSANNRTAVCYYNNATGYICVTIYEEHNLVLTHLHTESLFNGVSVNQYEHLACCAYDTDKWIIFYSVTGWGVYSRTFEWTGSSITAHSGPETFGFQSTTPIQYVCCCQVDINRVFVYLNNGHASWKKSYMQAIQLASDSISWSATAKEVSLDAAFLSICKVNTTTAILVYQLKGTSTGTAQCIAHNWSTHTYTSGTSVSTNDGDGTNYNTVTLPATDKVVIAHKCQVGSIGKFIVGTISGLTITLGDTATFYNADVRGTRLSVDTSSRVVVVYQDKGGSNEGKARYIDIDWDDKTGTVSEAFEFEGNAISGGTDFGLDIVKTGSFVIAYQDNDDSDYGKIIAGQYNDDPTPFLDPGEEPHRMFTIGPSDYSDRVLQWPTITRTANKLKSTNVSIPLANGDGALNSFYNNLYTLNSSCELIITTTDSSQSYPVFRGFLSDVFYANEKCIIRLKDRLWKFSSKSTGNSTVPASFSSQIPSDIAWTLCTCYGGLSDTEDITNTDIDFDSFAAWAKTFSDDAVACQASFPGVKVTDALTQVAEMTNGQIWVDRLGKVNFKAKIATVAADVTFVNDCIKDVSIDLGTTKIINKQHVYGAYDVESSDWFINVVNVDASSISSYGIHEDIIKSNFVWYTSSVDMLALAGKRTGAFRQPPKTFDIQTPLMTLNTDIGDKVRFVDSFFAINSSQSWRIVSNEINMDTGIITNELDGAASLIPFTLDVSALDGPDLLL